MTLPGPAISPPIWWEPTDIVGDVRHWRDLGLLPESFDLVIAIDVLQEFDCSGACFDLLVPGGDLFVVAPIPGSEWLARGLAAVGVRKTPAVPAQRAVHLRDLRGFRVTAERRARGIESWARLRKPL